MSESQLKAEIFIYILQRSASYKKNRGYSRRSQIITTDSIRTGEILEFASEFSPGNCRAFKKRWGKAGRWKRKPPNTLRITRRIVPPPFGAPLEAREILEVPARLSFDRIGW